jgi:hypothetical protein
LLPRRIADSDWLTTGSDGGISVAQINHLGSGYRRFWCGVCLGRPVLGLLLAVMVRGWRGLRPVRGSPACMVSRSC